MSHSKYRASVALAFTNLPRPIVQKHKPTHPRHAEPHHAISVAVPSDMLLSLPQKHSLLLNCQLLDA